MKKIQFISISFKSILCVFIFLCPLILNGQPKVRITAKKSEDAFSYRRVPKLEEASNGKYGFYYYATDGKRSTYIKPIFDIASSAIELPYVQKENQGSEYVSIIKYKGAWSILNLKDGSYKVLDGKQQFASCPLVSRRDGSYIFKNAQGGYYIHKQQGETQEVVKTEYDNTVVYHEGTNALHIVAKSTPFDFKSFPILLKMGSHYVIQTQIERFGVFTNGSFYPFQVIACQDFDKISDFIIKNDLINIIREGGNHDFTIFPQSNTYTYKTMENAFVVVHCKKEVYRDNSGKTYTINPKATQMCGVCIAKKTGTTSWGIMLNGKFCQLKTNDELDHDEIYRFITKTNLQNTTEAEGNHDFTILSRNNAYTYRTKQNAFVIVWGSKEVYRDISGESYIYQQGNCLSIVKGVDVGAVNTDIGATICPQYEDIVVDKRYKTFNNEDIVVVSMSDWKFIPDYDNMLYHRVISAESAAQKWENANRYINDTCFTKKEKKNYDAVLKLREQAEQELFALDTKLYSELPLDEYIQTSLIPKETKRHLNEAVAIKDLYISRNQSYYSFEIDSLICRIGKDVKSRNGFLFRNQPYDDTEVIVNFNQNYPSWIAISCRKLTADGGTDYNKLKLSKYCHVGEKTIILYRYEQIEHIKVMSTWDVVDYRANPVTGKWEKVYGEKNFYNSLDKSKKFIAIVGKSGFEKKILVPMHFNDIRGIGDEVIMLSTSEVRCVHLRDGTDRLLYKCDENTCIYDVGYTLDGRFVLVGKRANNAYMAIMTSKGEMLHEEVIGDYLDGFSKIEVSYIIDTFVVTITGGRRRKITINKDNTISFGQWQWIW